MPRVVRHDCALRELLAEHGRDRVDALARRAVDDAGAARIGDVPEERRVAILVRLRATALVDEVRAVEAGDDDLRLLEVEQADDVATDILGRRRGQGDRGRVAEALAEVADLRVFRSEVVAPLADAMGLVDREQAHARAVEDAVELARGQALGREVDEPLEAGLTDLRDRLAALARVERAVEEDGVDAPLAQLAT
jgi:hypothetical protein